MRLTGFFVLTFAITWGLWGIAVRTPEGGPRGFLFLIGIFTPGLVALGLTGLAGGRRAVAALLRRLVDVRVSVRWYLFALGYLAAIKLTVAVAHRAMTGDWPRFGDTPWPLLFAAAIGSTLTGGQVGEELGWRGYALPRLAGRLGLGLGSIVLGVLWACWHLPLFFVPSADTFRQSFPSYLLQVTALSVAMAWLFANTRATLPPVMLMHAAVNNTKDIVPSAEAGAGDVWALSRSPVAWLTVALLAACAGYFLLRMRRDPALGRTVTRSIDG